MAQRTLAIKYTSEGLSAVTSALQKVSFAFDEALSKAQDTVEDAVRASQAALKAGDAKAFIEAENKKALAAKQSANLIKNAYRELGVQSEADIESLKKQAVAAFEAIKNSGVASARDISEAQKQLDRRLEQLNAQLKDSSNRWGRVTESISVAKLAMSSFLGNLAANTVTGFFTSITGAATNFFRGLTSNVIQVGTTAEKQAVAFETFLGSAEKARAILQDVRDFAATTPFELPEVTEAAKQLLATRTEAEDLIPTIKMLGEIAAGADKPLTQLLFVYTQIKNQGRATAEDINQLLNAGLSMDDIARALGKTVAQLNEMKLSSKGLQLSFEEVEKVLKGVTSEGGRFFGLMDKLGSTTAVKLSNLNDAFTKIYQSIYDGISPAIAGVLDLLVGILNPLGENKTLFEEINEQAQDFRDYLSANPEIAQEITRQLESGIKVAMTGITATAKQLLDYLKANPTAIEDAVKSMGTLLNLTKQLLDVVGMVLKGYQAIADTIRVVGQEVERVTSFVGPVEIDRQIRSAGGNDEDIRRATDRIKEEESKLGPMAALWPFSGEVQAIRRRILEEELGRLRNSFGQYGGDFPGPAIPSGGSKPLPVPKPPVARSNKPLPPPPSSGTGSSSSGSRTNSGYAAGFERLSDLENFLNTNPLFANNPTARAVALAIAAGEVTGWLGANSRANLFSTMGGAGNAMQGFAQFNTGVHDRRQFDNPVKYLDFLAKMLTGRSSIPTGNGRFNIKELENLISSGKINTPQQFLSYLQNALPIANWEGLFNRGAQSILKSRVLDVQLNRLSSGIPNNQIRTIEAELERTEKERDRAEKEAERAREREEQARRRFQDAVTPDAIYPELGVFGIFQDLLLNRFGFERQVGRISSTPLPDFGEISPPLEFAGFSFGTPTFGEGISPVTYPDRLVEMAEKARLAMEQLDEMMARFVETGTVGVDRVSTGFENLGQTVTEIARDAFGQFFQDVLTGQRSVGDALLDLLSNFLDNIANMFASIATNSLMNWIGGLFGGGGGFSFGGLFGGGGGGIPDIFGGGATFSTMALPGFARGGRVPGSVTGLGDNLLARLRSGEWVINDDAVRYWGDDFLDSINRKRPPSLNLDLGESPSNRTSTIVNNVNVSATDVNSFKRSERQIGRMLSEYAQRS